MSALTRILNNQIYSKTIIASQKIADGTITGSLFSSNVTVPGDFLITGNLFVLGSSAYTTIASTNTYVNDPLIVLNNGFAGTNTYDEGFIFNRGSLQNRALLWSEYFQEFRLVGTTETGTAYGNVAVSNYANLHIGNLTVDYTANVTNLNATGFINTSGNVSAAVGVFGGVNSTGFINTSGNVSAAVGVFGGVNTTGYINAGGNVSTPQLNAGQINTTGNVLATAGVFNALTVNGNQLVTGYVNVTGNVLADAGTLNTLAINSSTNASDSSGSTGALQIKGGVSIAKDLYVGGNLYAANIVGITANVITVEDPLLFLKPSYTFPYNYDIGIYSSFTGSGLSTLANVLQHTGIVRHQETNTWTFASNLAEPGAGHVVFDNNTVYDPIKAGNLNLVGTNDSSSSSTGALIVAGGAGVGGNLNIAGGNYLTLGKNLASGIVYPEDTVQITTSSNAVSRISIQNLSSGQLSGSEFTAMADNGSNVSAFITTGIAGSTFNSTVLAPIVKPNDGFTLATGNLVLIGSSDVVISANGSSQVGVRISKVNSNVGVQYSTASSSYTTGAFTVVGGVGIGGEVYAARGAVFNSTNTASPFQVKSSTSGNVAVYANVNAGYAAFTESVIIGGGNTTVQPGATLKVNSVTAMMIPAGPTAARPSSLLGFPEADAPGMIRFNTTSNALEYYDGSVWTVAGSVFTVISDRQFSGNVAGGFGNVDGSNTQFTLQSTATTSGAIVSINGVMQFPTLAYSVSGTTLTFTEPPAPNDVIDVRILTTTSTVTSIASATGLNQFIADDTALQFWTGSAATIQRANIDQSGNFNFLTGNEFTYDQTPTQVVNTNLTLLDSFSANAFTTAKYIISMKQDTGNVQAMEALLTQSTVGSTAGTAYVTTYGIINTGNTMGTLAANVDVSGSWTVKMWLIPNAATAISNVKVMTTYIV
jgi:hypothetical protein